MKSVNRKTGLISDYEPSNSVKFLYENAFGRLLLKLMNNHVFSKLVGSYMNSSLSKGRVKKTAAEYHIKLDQEYHSYNEFFTRRMDYNIDADRNSFISPCESKLLAFKLDGEGKFNIKESLYTAREIINDDIIDEYQGGYCLIFRLEVNNYHHYLFVDNGTKEADHFIKGKLHTVQPIAYKRYKVFHENSRMWTILHTENFGDIIDCEVGAICIGKIVNEKVDNFKKGDEKGHFEFGGSTIILFVKKDQVIIDQDILDHSKNLMETEVSIGEKIGIKK